MLSFDDKRWGSLLGGYRVPFDPRPLLQKLELGQNTESVWEELWNELHHQGDVGEASYACIPHLVRIYREKRGGYWNTYAIVAVIDLARDKPRNPPVPDWLRLDYFQAIQELFKVGTLDIQNATDTEEVLAILSVLALAKGARTHARFLLENSAADLIDLEERAHGSE